MSDVRSKQGAPVLSDFRSKDGTPVVIDRDEPAAYVVDTNDNIVKIGGPSGGVTGTHKNILFFGSAGTIDEDNRFQFSDSVGFAYAGISGAAAGNENALYAVNTDTTATSSAGFFAAHKSSATGFSYLDLLRYDSVTGLIAAGWKVTCFQGDSDNLQFYKITAGGSSSLRYTFTTDDIRVHHGGVYSGYDEDSGVFQAGRPGLNAWLSYVDAGFAGGLGRGILGVDLNGGNIATFAWDEFSAYMDSNKPFGWFSGTVFSLPSLVWEMGPVTGGWAINSGAVSVGDTTRVFFADDDLNVAVGPSGMGTTATDGHFHIPAVGGTPTGVPTAITDHAPIVIDNSNDALYFYSNGAWHLAGGGGTSSPSPKAAWVESPTASEKIVLFALDANWTLASIDAVLPAGASTPSVTFSIRYGTDVSASGTEVKTGGITVTSTTTATSTTSLDNPVLSAGDFVWLTTTAVSGDVPALSVVLL